MATKTVCDGCGKEALGIGYLESWIRIESYFRSSFYNWRMETCSEECAHVALTKAMSEINRRKAISRQM